MFNTPNLADSIPEPFVLDLCPCPQQDSVSRYVSLEKDLDLEHPQL